MRSFTDPLNASVNSMKVEVFGTSCTPGSIEVSLNGNVLGELASLTDDYCDCGDCYSSSNTFTFDSAWYNVGGSNEIKIGNSVLLLCIDRVGLTRSLCYCK